MTLSDDQVAAQRDFAEAAGLQFLGDDDCDDDELSYAHAITRQLAQELDLLAKDFVNCKDPEVLAAFLVGLRGKSGVPGIRQRLEEIIAQAQERLVVAMGSRWEIETKSGVLVRHGAKRRTRWRFDEAMDDVLRIVQSGPQHDPETGERIDGAERMADAIRRVFGFAYCRSTAMKRLDLDPDEYCEVSWGQETVEVK